MNFFFYKFLAIPREFRQFFYLRFNQLYFKLAGVNFGKGLTVFNKVYLKVAKSSSISIGKNLVITSGDSINPLCRTQRACLYVRKGAKLIIGDDCGFSSPCFWCDDQIVVGNRVKMGGDCVIIDSDAHSLDYRDRAIESNISSEDAFLKVKHAPIEIEDDVWIGTRCIIMKGVTIGARSVVGAGSIVTKDVPADTLVCGSPAKVIRTLV